MIAVQIMGMNDLDSGIFALDSWQNREQNLYCKIIKILDCSQMVWM